MYIHCCHGNVQQLSEEYASYDMIFSFIVNIYICTNTPSNAIVKVASNISYTLLVEADVTGGCFCNSFHEGA